MQKKTIVALIVGLLILGAIPLLVSAQGMRNRNGTGTQTQNNQTQWNGRGNNRNQQSTNQYNGQSNNWNQGSQTRMNGQRNPQNSGMSNGTGLYSNLPPVVDGDLSQDVIDAMTEGIMDEYNAYNTYQAVINQFGAVNPFVSIQRAEAQHISAWEMLFTRYGLDIPEAPALDETLTFNSLSDACTAAANAEVANFELYDQMLETLADYPDMVRVVTNLRNVSEYNHLVAFQQCAG